MYPYRQKEAQIEKVDQSQGLWSGFISKIFSGAKKANTISVTSMATNGKTIILGYSNGTWAIYDLKSRKLQDKIYQLSSSEQPVSKLEVHYYETVDKEVKATILISLINGIVKWWDYETLNLYARLNVDMVVDFSYFKAKSLPNIGVITKNKYIHVYRWDDFWTFTKIIKVKLKKTPLNFIISKDKGIISYSDNYEFFKIITDQNQKMRIETQNLLSKTLVDKTAPIIYLDALRAFVISKSRWSYYVDKMSGSINKGSSIKIIWRAGTPHKVMVVRPYLIGIMEDAIEIKCLFNPNRVTQIIQDPSFNIWEVAVNKGLLEDTYLTHLDSLFIYSYDKDEDDPSYWVHKLTELVQIDGKRQVLNLIENELYSTAMKIWEFLMNKNYEGLSSQEYHNFQKGRAFYCFFTKKDYKLSISLLKKVNVPTEEVILLFTDLYPKYAIDQMIERFGINIKNIPYLKDQIDIYNPVINSMIYENKRKRTLSYVKNNPKYSKLLSCDQVYLYFRYDQRKQRWKVYMHFWTY